MATTEAALPESESPGGHGHDHDHPPFLAHHFDTPEQQFDSGKLGMWIFLVTEVLFFSGMFCAYAVYRMLRPEVFEGCSQFLNTQLGAINTGVLLFSSLTMAWAVRCAQLEEHKKLTALLATTLSCAMIFLGVKAIEYSHKWTMGLLPAGLYHYDPAHPHPEGGPNFLLWFCAPFAALTVGTAVWCGVAFLRGKAFQLSVSKPLTVVCLCFFLGVALGSVLEGGGENASHASADHAGQYHAAGASGDDHAGSGDEADRGDGVAEQQPEPSVAEVKTPANGVDVAEPYAGPDSPGTAALERLAADETNTGVQSELKARQTQRQLGGTVVAPRGDELATPIESVPTNVLQPGLAGVFFGIYYCMTGIHAIHIIAGVGVLVWLLVRSARHDFNRQYFGPVDYVGLYWHLVDLIWIYLFPLLYLIR